MTRTYKNCTITKDYEAYTVEGIGDPIAFRRLREAKAWIDNQENKTMTKQNNTAGKKASVTRWNNRLARVSDRILALVESGDLTPSTLMGGLYRLGDAGGLTCGACGETSLVLYTAHPHDPHSCGVEILCSCGASLICEVYGPPSPSQRDARTGYPQAGHTSATLSLVEALLDGRTCALTSRAATELQQYGYIVGA